MKKLFFLIILPALIMTQACNNKQSIDYPVTTKVDQVDEYFGVKVEDPYRWLEDDTSSATKKWVKAQNKVTFDYLNKIPFREKVEDRLTKIWDYPKESAPFKEGGHYFVYKNSGLQNQSVIYIKDDLEDEGEVFINPNTLSEDGTVSLTNFEVSDDGKYAAYGISRGGSDWREFYVREVATGEDLDDHIMWAKFSGISWYKDGFFYSRYPSPEKGDKLSGVNENNKVYYHKIGTDQSKDKLVYEEPDNPQRGFGVQVTEDDKYIILYTTESTSGNGLYFKRLDKKNAEFNKLITNFENDYGVVGHYNGKFFVRTNDGAPKYRLMAVDPNNPEKENWEELIPEAEEVLNSVSVVGGKMFANYMKDAHSLVKVFKMDGQFAYNIDADLGTISGFYGKKDDNITFYSLTSFTTPSTIYKYNVAENKSTVYKHSGIDFDPEKYETKQVFYESKDGTKVPMFITHKKGLELDGTNPTLLYGYGGFNVSLTPRFRITMVPWLENGGVYAQANIRGGGEYGEDWHLAGTKMKKQNVFDDFIAAAEYLINEDYTNSNRLAIQGGSNGGLLVGAVTNQRPELFEVALPAVGVMDMLRYHKFTIGRYWASDYGTSEDSKEMFEYLYNYSPLHSVKSGKEYPAILVTTADHDDRVVPAHSFKYIATVQEKETGHNPTLIRIETKAGHGAGTPTSKAIEQAADIMSFVWYNMDYAPEFE
jgi:prolyl oligopeptidase